MPDFKCPRCNATLREEDTDTWALPFDPVWDHFPTSAIQFICWRCSWSVIWVSPNLSKATEVDLPA